MSREEWLRPPGIATGFDAMFEKCRRKGKFSDKTSDPEAADIDEANRLFLKGLEAYRCGNLDAATALIAHAYLLHTTGINYAMFIPPTADDKKREIFIDLEMLQHLGRHNSSAEGKKVTYRYCVLNMMMGQLAGSHPLIGQGCISIATSTMDDMLKMLQKNPQLDGNADIIGGCLTTKNILRLRSSLYMAMGNRKMAVKDLTKALDIDESFTVTRIYRTSLWANFKLKNGKIIHNEYKRIVAELHKDNDENEIAYAWLALTTLDDSSLGSTEDAKGYYEKCLKSIARTDEIYGKRAKEELPPILNAAHQRFSLVPCSLDLQRTILDIGNRLAGTALGTKDVSTKEKYLCVHCGASNASNGDKLSQCARCKLVRYCSRECQLNDWKSHKDYCNLAKNGGLNVSKTG